MPIIFASSLLLFPLMIFGWLASQFPGDSVLRTLEGSFHRGESFLYNILYVALIYFFCYFWTAITFNPKDMADNLKNYGSFIPGYRPGRRTADYLEKVMVRITYVGAGFLSLVAIIPTIVSSSMGVPYSIAAFYGGTSLLDRRECGLRPGAEDRQPPRDAELQGPVGKRVMMCESYSSALRRRQRHASRVPGRPVSHGAPVDGRFAPPGLRCEDSLGIESAGSTCRRANWSPMPSSST